MTNTAGFGGMDFDGDGLTNDQERAMVTDPFVNNDEAAVPEWFRPRAATPAPPPENTFIPGVRTDLDDSMEKVRGGLSKADSTFQQSIAEADGVSEMISAFGKYISDAGGPVGDFGDGLGDVLEHGIAKEFHSDGVGTGILQETAEGFFGVVGEGVEMIAEAGAGVGEAAMVLTGGVIEAVGGTASSLRDAGSALLDGDIGGAADHAYEAVKSVVGLAGTAIDTGKAAGHAVGEVVEGVASMGYEAVEGVVEMGIGLGRNIGQAGEALGGVVADGAGYVAEAASDGYDAVSDAVSDGYDSVSDAASDAYDSVSEFFSY